MSQEQIQKPAQSGTAPLNFDELNIEELSSTGENRAYTGLKPEDQKRADSLAAKVNLDTFGLLLKEGEKARSAISAVSQTMIGDTRLGEVPMLGELFSSLNNAEKELDVESVHQKIGPLRRFFMALIGKRLDPIIRFIERWKKVKTVLAEKRKTCADMEVKCETARGQLTQLKNNILKAFVESEVVIGAAEQVLIRERESLREDVLKLKASAQPNNIIEKQKLFSRKKAIVRLDNLLMALQNERIIFLSNLGMIDMSIDNRDNLKEHLRTIREVTINALETGVALAIEIYDQRQQAQFGNQVQSQSTRLLMANAKALGMAQEELHKLNTREAQASALIVAAMDQLSAVNLRSVELMNENVRLNSEARKTLAEGEKRFKEAMEKTLDEAIKEAA